jgi:hypothetical protein
VYVDLYAGPGRLPPQRRQLVQAVPGTHRRTRGAVARLDIGPSDSYSILVTVCISGRLVMVDSFPGARGGGPVRAGGHLIHDGGQGREEICYVEERGEVLAGSKCGAVHSGTVPYDFDL